jgi:hypothetical protein
MRGTYYVHAVFACDHYRLRSMQVQHGSASPEPHRPHAGRDSYRGAKSTWRGRLALSEIRNLALTRQPRARAQPCSIGDGLTWAADRSSRGEGLATTARLMNDAR